jgi:lipopolysaccharide/colanic/teichoic acid biosynthesis glycosyltransferase
MVKFRTMTDERGPDGELLPDEQRLTPFGKFLRSSTLDEFPEMWNVLTGDMSVVGPRPLLMRYVPRYSPFQARRMEVKPGVTGWAQVNGRNSLSWEEKFALDVWYIDHRSFWLDMRIVVMTFFKVFARSGINSGEGKTMDEFRGAEKQ